jgi:hypothetical protein
MYQVIYNNNRKEIEVISMARKIGEKTIEIDGENVVVKIYSAGKAYGWETFNNKPTKCKYKNTRSQRLKRTTEIKTKKITEKNDPIRTEWNTDV